ncbi:MAG TPA: hypothetical protein VG757_03670 [Devosia sp.]|nr:hypothetical protein [Devosia sp.]
MELVARKPGLSDREITNILFSHSKHPSQVNQECRLLEQSGVLKRQSDNESIRNYLAGVPSPNASPAISPKFISEDDVKRAVSVWLVADGWSTTVRWGRDRGIDIFAQRGEESWIVEAKGSGSLQPMRVNYFLSMLGETLQRMVSEEARYSIALPDFPQFRGLWKRLPALAKARTTITMLFVTEAGEVEHSTS